MLETKDLSFSYEGGTSLNFPNLNIKKGDSCLILGQSGCGKTTLLHLLGGLLTTQNGRIIINSTDVSMLNGRQLDLFRGKNIGFIFQQPHLIKAFSVKENLQLAQYMAGVKSDKNRVPEVLEALGMQDNINSRVYKLSQGQQQRVAIARAAVNKPSIILADEPTSSLDDENCDKVMELLMEISQMNNSSLIITTHDSRLKESISNQIKLTSI